MIERLAERYADSVPDYNLVKYDYVAFPLYKILLSVTIQQRKEIGVIEEFVLKLLDANVGRVEDMAHCLGLDESLINEALVNLASNDLVYLITGKYKMSDRGRECLRISKMLEPEEMIYTFLLDALTGEYLPERATMKAKDVKQHQIHTLNKAIDEPKVEDLDFQELSRLLKKQQKETMVDGTYYGDLISINSIQKCYTEYRKRSMLVYTHKDNPESIDLKIFEGFDRVADYEPILIRMENESIRQIPTDKALQFGSNNNQFPTIVPKEVLESARENKKKNTHYKKLEESLTQRIVDQESRFEEWVYSSQEEKMSATQEIKDLKKQLEELRKQQASNNQLLETYNHRPLLEKSLKEAKSFVVIVSPWIRFGAFDNDLQNLIKNALRRNVRIIIGYGISEEDAENDKAEKILKEIQQQKGTGKNLTLIKLGNTHEKVLLVDGRYVVITSFNWLSFKGDPKRGFRQETGIYTEDEGTINSTIESLQQRMNIDIKQYLTYKPQITAN
jgi:Mn-dependent DtxR family transcriptional regulator/ribosomal protein S15P/S13E